MISDRNSRRSKGIAYIEFVEASSVPLAIGLTGQRLLGVPIIVQASQVQVLDFFLPDVTEHINSKYLLIKQIFQMETDLTQITFGFGQIMYFYVDILDYIAFHM